MKTNKSFEGTHLFNIVMQGRKQMQKYFFMEKQKRKRWRQNKMIFILFYFFLFFSFKISTTPPKEENPKNTKNEK